MSPHFLRFWTCEEKDMFCLQAPHFFSASYLRYSVKTSQMRYYEYRHVATSPTKSWRRRAARSGAGGRDSGAVREAGWMWLIYECLDQWTEQWWGTQQMSSSAVLSPHSFDAARTHNSWCVALEWNVVDSATCCCRRRLSVRSSVCLAVPVYVCVRRRAPLQDNCAFILPDSTFRGAAGPREILLLLHRRR